MAKATETVRDSTIAEIHRTRAAMAARFHGDLFALTADAQKRAEASGRKIVRRGEASKTAMPQSGRPGGLPGEGQSPPGDG